MPLPARPSRLATPDCPLPIGARVYDGSQRSIVGDPLTRRKLVEVWHGGALDTWEGDQEPLARYLLAHHVHTDNKWTGVEGVDGLVVALAAARLLDQESELLLREQKLAALRADDGGVAKQRASSEQVEAQEEEKRRAKLETATVPRSARRLAY